MVKRSFITLTLAFVLSTLGVVLMPYVGRLAQPFLCAGTLEPETRIRGLEFRCIEAADGRITRVAPSDVVLYSIPLLALTLIVPVHSAVAAAERRATRAKGAMSADLEVAIRARAEILRIGRQSSLGRQALIRAAQLHLVLWVQPPNGRPYEAKVSWLVEDESLARLSVGTIVPVKVNPRRPEHVYPDQPWAHYAWWN